MIWRIWFILMIVVVTGAWLLTVPFSPSATSKAASNIADYRSGGLMPPEGGLTLSAEVGHEVFELPADDAGHLREAMEAGGGMPAMEGMEMAEDPEEHSAESMEMEIPMSSDPGMAEHGGADVKMTAPSPPEAADLGDKAMSMPMPVELAPGDHGKPEGAEMAALEDHAKPLGHGGGGEMAGIQVLAQGSGEEIEPLVKGVPVDRTIDVAMTEWGYDPPRLMVEAGEVVRLVVRNDGRLPHEFMLMTGAGMAAVDYRIERADWNLLEHEAIAEVPIVMPGDRFEIVARIHRPGSWMFMCMFPYHMQLGMMGMMMTEGATMDADMDMGADMKM